MICVPFGATCNYNQISCKEIWSSNPETYMMNNALYVDHLYYGSDIVEQALNLDVKAVTILNDVGMKLRMFAANSEKIKNTTVSE